MAKDIYHSNVREALEKEGWTIVRDPLRIYISETDYVDIDMAAEKDFLESEDGFMAEKGEAKIAVEVKSFIRRSFISAFHEAIGQYLDYKSALSDTEPDRVIYLAIPDIAYAEDLFQSDGFFEKRFIEEEANVIVFNARENIIEKWINYKNTSKS